MKNDALVERLASSSVDFFCALRALDGFDEELFRNLCEVLEACAKAWRLESEVPKRGAAILLEVIESSAGVAVIYEGAEGRRVARALAAVSKLVFDCVHQEGRGA